jgi:hypothetical protein
MVYSYFVEKLARQSFANVQNHNYDEVLKALAPNVTHRFAGDLRKAKGASQSLIRARD